MQAKDTEVIKNRERGGKCTRCMRDTHYANKCYAKTDINGFLLFD